MVEENTKNMNKRRGREMKVERTRTNPHHPSNPPTPPSPKP